MIKLDDGEVISEAEQVAGIVEQTGTMINEGVSKVLSIRIQLRILDDVQALTQKSGKSRNFMIERLLEVGLEEVHKQLSEKTMQEVNELTSESYGDLFAEAGLC